MEKLEFVKKVTALYKLPETYVADLYEDLKNRGLLMFFEIKMKTGSIRSKEDIKKIFY